jgi:hypothetical protein
MPAESKAQQQYMGIQLEKAREGKPHEVSEKVAREFAGTKTKGLPRHVKREKSRSGGRR